MADRFGGPYSPDGSRRPDPAGPTGPPLRPTIQRRSRMASRARLLFFAPAIILINAFRIDAAHLLPGLAAFGILILAAWLTQTGVMAQAAYDARTVARKPAIPRKLFATALTFVGLTLAGTMSQPTLLLPLGFGLAGDTLTINQLVIAEDGQWDATVYDRTLKDADHMNLAFTRVTNGVIARQAKLSMTRSKD